MIELNNVTKRLGKRRVIDDLTLHVPKGSLFGLLGPNGAGKTTTVRLVAGGLVPDGGEVMVSGYAARTPMAKRMIGIVPQSLAVYDNLTGEANMKFFGNLYGMRNAELDGEIERALNVVQLWDRRKDRVKSYSGGMKRRLNIALALLHNPSLLILDEPTVGVDPHSRNAIFDAIRELNKAGCTIILTSHYLEEAQQLCDHVAIMDEGKLLAAGTVDEVIKRHGGDTLLMVETANGKMKFETSDAVADIVRINAEQPILSLKMESPGLEKAFLNITGKQLRDQL